MKRTVKFTWFLLTTFLGSLWAYSFSTRIGLLFNVPLELKLVVLGGLGLNFALLAFYWVRRYLAWQAPRRTKTWLLTALALTALVFIIAPYRHVPFRTTHELEIAAPVTEVKLVAAFSPDDNLIPREAFQFANGVSEFDANGYRLAPNSTLHYRRTQTGGLTLSFTADSGEVALTWDGATQVLDPAAVQAGEGFESPGWEAAIEPQTGRVLVSLPGTTWGAPDPLWTILGALLPVADFVTLTSLLILLGWFILLQRENGHAVKVGGSWVKAWIEALICIGLAAILIKIGFPDFIPGWFLLFFIPAIAYLTYHQVRSLIARGDLSGKRFSALQRRLAQVKLLLVRLNHSRWTFWVLIGMVALLATAAQLYLTAPGMGISGDSVHYLEGARNMAAGNGYVRQIAEGDPVVMTGFPPVYPAALLPGIWLGIGLETYARYLNTFLLIVTLILTGWLVFKTTRKALPAFLATAFLAMAGSILNIYSWIMSEPLFLVLLLVSILLWFWQVKKPTLWKALLIGATAGIMTNTRLAGIAFIPVFALGLLLYQPGKFRRRLRDALLLGVSAVIQPAAFFIRNSLVADRVSESRGLTVATFKMEYWEVIGAEVGGWFKWSTFFNLPYQRFNALFITLGVILLLVLGWLIFRKHFSGREKSDAIIVLLLIAIPTYLAVIVLNTILFTPQQTDYGLTRYMIPMLLILVILLGKLLSDYWDLPALFPKVIILFVVLVAFQFYVESSTEFVREPPLGFRNYTDNRNECGQDVIEITQAYPDTSFMTNNCEYFYFLTGKTCRHLSLEAGDYQPAGEVYQAAQAGAIVAYSPVFGTEPPGIGDFLSELDHLESSCYLEFYRWPGVEN